MEPIELAAVLAAAVLVASMASVELGVTVALIELTLGVVAGNLFDLQSQEWLDFIAAFASIVLTFLAGMEVDTDYMRDRAKATVGLGVASFAGPFLVASLVCYLALEWSGRASLIAGTALSTTSLAVVYAVLVERDLSDTRIGKLLMSATFVTDLCTALALGLTLPAEPLVSGIPPRLARAHPAAAADRALVLRPLRRPRDRARDQARLRQPAPLDGARGCLEWPRRPARLRAGPTTSRHYEEHREEQTRLRVVAFSFLTPFFFLKGGLNVSLSAVFANLGLLAVLLAAKMLPKLGFVYPLARRAAPRHATFSTLLMSTGLTFGTISALFGLNAGIIDKTQFSLLVTVVVLSAVVPTAIAERWFLPDPERERHEERRHAPFPAEEYV